MVQHNACTDWEQTRLQLQRTVGLPFSQLVSADKVAAIVASLGCIFRDRIYTPTATLWMFLSQVLSADHSCQDAVCRLLAWRLSQGLKPCSSETTSYCEARQRLPVEVIQTLTRDVAREAESQAEPSWLWKGRHVKIVDGTTVTMPDTAANQEAYPRRRNQSRGVGFPIARVVVMVSLAYGTVLDLAIGPMRGKKTGETTLFRTMTGVLESNDVALFDRLFGSYQELATLPREGVDVVARQHATRHTDFRRGQWLGILDHLVLWKRPKFSSARFDRATWEALPECMLVRELRFHVTQSGFRPGEITIVTTLLDPVAYSREEIAELYHQRWHCELDLRSLKTSLQMARLRCKSPEMVEKEIWMHALACNLIRQIMSEAARAHALLPCQLSFKTAVQMVNNFAIYLSLQLPNEDSLWIALLTAFSIHIVGDRPNRVEPRKLKSRIGKYTHMTRPRNEERELLYA